MNLTIGLLSFFLLVVTIGAPPVVEKADKHKAGDKTADDSSEDVLNNLEYGRYLKEVVEILERDPSFKSKIENTSVDDIKSGSIAQHLSLVNHRVRTQLDEAKQREMQRLRELIARKMRNLNHRQRAGGDIDKHVKDILPLHIDHQNGETFGELDLERLIRHASRDLDELDRKREEEFKQYEMQKEYERRNQLSKVDEEQRKKLEALYQETLEKKKHHPKVNHPGSVDQMEEVWENVDHLEADQFSPKAFFKLHDVNSDGFLDEGEIEAIMLKEAEKIHEGDGGDPIEKQEEMDRMREHVMREFDKNNDRMLSFDEFKTGINGTAAKNDQGWQSIEDSTVFSDQEFQHFSEHLVQVSTPIPAGQPFAPPAGNQPPPPQQQQQQQQQHIPRAPPVPQAPAPNSH